MVKMVNTCKVYRTDTVETTALASVNLEVADGEFVAVMGPSGCGKSTLLNVLGLVDAPTSGEVILFGQETARLTERRRGELRKGRIGFIFQSFNLIEDLTAARNVEVPLLYLRMPAPERARRVSQALERVGMTHRRDHYPSQLSGGEQQRVAIARAIVADQPLILADEPTGNLDVRNGSDVMRLLADVNGGGATVVMVTHSAEHTNAADRVVYLRDGRTAGEERRGGLDERAGRQREPQAAACVESAR